MSTDKAKGLLAKIKELFTAAEGGVTLLEHKLADGTVLEMDKMLPGGKLTVNKVPVTAAGEYTLVDGTKIVYDVAGVITGVTPPAVAPTPTTAPAAAAPATTQVAFTDYKLVDGTVISCDKLEVGGAVQIGGVPAPAGEYKMEDGSLITVDATGLITAVTPNPAAAAPAAPMAAAPAAPAPVPVTQAAHEELVGKFKKMEMEFGSVKAKAKIQEDTLKQMFELMQEIVGLPTSDPPPNGRRKFSFSNVELKSKSLEKYQAAAAKMAEEHEERLKIA